MNSRKDRRQLVVEQLESRCLMAARVFENFQDGTATDTFDESLVSSNESIRTAPSGNKYYQIRYARNDATGGLRRYPATFSSLRVSYSQLYPDGMSFDSRSDGAAIKQFRVFNSEGGMVLNIEISRSKATNGVYYNLSGFQLANGQSGDVSFYDIPVPRQWFRNQIELTLNTRGVANGTLKVWHNDELIYNRTNLVFLRDGVRRPDGFWVGGNANYNADDAHLPWTSFRRLIDGVSYQFNPPGLSAAPLFQPETSLKSNAPQHIEPEPSWPGVGETARAADFTAHAADWVAAAGTGLLEEGAF